MGKTASSGSQILSLPKGGGALPGIGEKFSPDLHTGTGNFTVPLALPAGRNGFQPQLNLAYSTGNGNGPFGLGWGLSLPGVRRQTAKGVPQYDDARDRFILSGAEDLVPVPGGFPGTTRFRPRTEGLFARIEHHHDASNDYWEVRGQDGLVSHYGTPGASAHDPGVVADPEDRRRIFAWQLTQTEDPFGNRIVYDYGRDAGTDGPHDWDQLYLRRIRYADYTQDGQTQFLVSVTFAYTARPDSYSEYRTGFEVRTRLRCTHIEVRTHADIERLVRTYHLIYLDQRASMQHLLPHNGVSLLSQIQVIGHDGDRTEELPPLELGYTRFAPEGRKFSQVGGAELPARSLANPDLEVVDLFGDGLPDILEMNGSLRYWRNLGGGRFDRPRELQHAPAGVHLADPGVQLLDADGDGRIDLLVTTETLSGYFPLRADGLWDRRSFQPYRVAPSFSLEDPEVKLVDLDGNGVTDAIRSGSRFECFFNDSQEGWNSTRLVDRQAIEAFPNVNFSDPRVKHGDMTGDGLQDIALVHDGGVDYWPALGRGQWGKRVTMQNSPRLPHGYDHKRILVGDVDGDGLADIVYVDNFRVTLWINQHGSRWSDPINIKGTPPVSDAESVRLVDLLGSGISGVLWSADAHEPGRGTMYFLDFTGGVKPYLLHEIDNHLGAHTRVEYAASTQFFLEDQRQPATRWRTTLPFPVQVVARVEVADALSGGKLTAEYRYHHGSWDGDEREFRGFGRVDQRDTEVFENFVAAHGEARKRSLEAAAESFSPPTETRTWFHQGPVGDASGEWGEIDYSGEYWPGDAPVLMRPQAMVDALQALPRRARRDALRALRGTVLRTEIYALDGTERQDRPYTVSEALFGVRQEAAAGSDAAERQRIFFPHPLAQRTTQWERGVDPMTQFTFTDDYDDYGRPRSQIAIAVPRGLDFRARAGARDPYLATCTDTTYAHREEPQHYLIGRVVRATVYEILNDGSLDISGLQASILNGSMARRLIGQTLQFYDGPAFLGLPFGQLGDHGVVARTETLVLTEEVLHKAYGAGDTPEAPPELPPYLIADGPPRWTAEYPQEFRALLLPLAGYIFQPGGAESPYARGYFVATERRRYDCQDGPAAAGRGLLKASRDPLGADLSIGYDRYDLLPIEATNAAGLTTRATYDYRVLQPQEVIDVNGNRTAYAFTPQGFLERSAVLGKAGETVGDTLEHPTVRLIYDFLAYAQRRQPVSVRTLRRRHHVHDSDVPAAERDEVIESVEYSDGFGRLLQTRAQAEDIIFGRSAFGDAGLAPDQAQPGGAAVGQRRAVGAPPHVVVSGWQLYDNKGRVVKKYEPFFSTGFDYAAPTDAQFGQQTTLSYDPRGQAVRLVYPNGAEQRVILGVPADLADPERYTPTPWEHYTYDANDNAGRTHPAASAGYRQHWNTPTSTVLDALGRTIETVVRNGPNPQADWHSTRCTYDIQGNLLTATDELGRLAFAHVYDLAKHPLRTAQVDAGEQRIVLNAAGNPLEVRDSKGALVLHAYDAVHRAVRLWARDGIGQALTLRQRLIYGDAADAALPPAQAAAVGLLGRLYRHYDEAGLLIAEAYDFKGNLLRKRRHVAADSAILRGFEVAPANDWQVQAFRIDWQAPDGVTLEDHAVELLDAMPYRTSMSYDALDRVKAMASPQDVEGKHRELRPLYNRAGALTQVELDGSTFVEHIAYNAKGQRLLVVYGNGVMTRYAYDPQTSRLVRMRSERLGSIGHDAPTAPVTYSPSGAALQDLAYEYDLAGNITSIRDRAPESGIPNSVLGPDALDREFAYDPLYRLLSATGRESDAPSPLPGRTQLVAST